MFNSSSSSSVQKSIDKRKTSSHYDSQVNVKRVRFDDVETPTNLDRDAINSRENTYRKGGLTHSLHGSIYQLKLQMLFLKRAIERGYEFNLGTEVEDAGKFDDIVFKYKKHDESGKTKIRFVQAKHKQDESNKITVNDLKSENNDFSLQKYFMSYRGIKQNYKSSEYELKDFILYTNIDFADITNESFEKTYIEEIDDILDVTKSGYNTERVKLIIPKEHALYQQLRETSDLHILANSLKQHIVDNKPLQLGVEIFKRYHGSLCKKIFDIESKTEKSNNNKVTKRIAKFSDNFLRGENLSEDVSKFREVLRTALALEHDQFRTELTQKTLKLSANFGQILELQAEPIITDPNDLAESFTNCIKKALKAQTYVIAISRQTNLIKSNINKLAFHILVKDEAQKELIKFRKAFFNEHQKLQGNLEEFRAALKTKLKRTEIDFTELIQYRYKISEFDICEETPEGELLYPKIELPKDDVNDVEIEDFINKLVFAVNQPNELELDEIIREEMGQCSQFNLLDANLISDSFQKKMLDWFKNKGSEKGEEGTWLDTESGKTFFDSIEEKISGLVSVGISVAYPEKLAAYDIAFGINDVFENLKTFLSQGFDSEKIFHLIAPEDTLLSAINVKSALEILKQQDEFAQYRKNDSHIFMRLSTLLGIQSQMYVIKAFKSKDSYDLFILDCNCTALERDLKILYIKLSRILQNQSKKIILITREHTRLDGFGKNLKSIIIKDNTQFNNLTKESQKKLLNKKVHFQGQRISFNEIINESDENTNKIIDVGTIVQLVRNREISIGRNLNDLGEVNDYYIDRRFRPVIFNKTKMEKYLNENNCETDLFIICGIKNPFNTIYKNIYFLDNIKSAECKFNELCGLNKESNIHWLNCDLKYLIWYKSRGSLSNLVQYEIKEKVHRTGDITRVPRLIEESKFVNEYAHQKLVIISDTAGMGKSTVLTHLSMQLGKCSSFQWIIRINLNDHTKVLQKVWDKKIKFSDQNINKVIDFFSNDLLTLREKSMLEKKLFNYSFNNNGKITFLFDGLDELSLNHKDIIIDLLKLLNKLQIGKIFVTTRPNLSEELEQELEVFSHVLEPLSKEEQIEFLTKFWIKKLELKDDDQNQTLRLQTYAENLIEHVSKSINDKEPALIGIPLQTMMLAEVFQEHQEGTSLEWQSCKEFLESQHMTPILPDNFALLDLYKRFIKNKFLFYLKEKKRRVLTIKGETEDAEAKYETFKTKHEQLALRTLFNEKELKELYSEIEMVKAEVDHDEGFIDRFIGDKPSFIHRTFAEYFASFPISEKMVATPAKTLQCIEDVLLNMSPVFIYSLIEKLDGNQQMITSALGKPLLCFAVIENHLNFIKSLLECDYNDWPKKLDASGKTTLHYAIEYRQNNMVKLLLDYANDTYVTDSILKHGSFKKPEYENFKLVKFINIQDKDGKTALYYAIRKNHLDLAFDLLLKGANIDSLVNDDINKLVNKMLKITSAADLYENGILAVYANQDNKYRPIQEKILLKSPSVFNELGEKDQSRILSYFFVHGRLAVVKALLGTIGDLERRRTILNNDDNSYTPLDRVNNSDELSDEDRLAITKYLCEHGGTNCNHTQSSNDLCSYKHISLILQGAAARGHIMTFNYFIAKENHENYNNHLYTACQYNQYNLIKYLCENHKENINEDGNTALHTACHGRVPLKIMKYLIDNGDINAANDKGETPIFMAIMVQSKLNVIDYLVTKGADVNWEARSGDTPLSLAIRGDQECIIKYLLGKKARISEKADQLIKDKFNFFIDPIQYNVDRVDETGYPRLHSAIKSKNVEWTQFLVRHGADINKVDKEGNTPFYWGAKLNQVPIVELLLQYGAAFVQVDSFPGSYGDSKIPWLLRLLNKLFSSQRLSQDLKDEILHANDGDWGPYGDGHPDAWDRDNPMIYILNARNHQRKSLFHIAADTNDVEAMSILLKFNKDYLEIKNYTYIYNRCQDYHSTSVDVRDSQGNTPLHLAAQKGHHEIAWRLLEKGTTFNSENNQGETAEIIATNNKHYEIVELLQPTKNLFIAIENENENTLEVENCIKKKAYLNAKNESHQTPLHLAAYLGQFVVVHLLLDNGANIEAINASKSTPLHMAAEQDEIKNVKLLLIHGAIYNPTNIKDQSPLELACGESRILLGQIDTLFKDIQSDDPHIVINNLENMQKTTEIAISTFVNIHDIEANTLLHFAAELGELDIVELLLKNGAIFDSRNKFKLTPQGLTRNDNIFILLESIKTMFENVRNIYQEREKVSIQIITNVRNDAGETLLYRAVELNEWETVKYLVERGAHVNLMDINLFKAMGGYFNLELKIIKYLIDNGDIDATNYKRETPLFMAIQARSDLSVIEYLVSKGSNVHSEDLCGNTPLSLAVESDQKHIIHYLLDKKASISEKVSEWIKNRIANEMKN